MSEESAEISKTAARPFAANAIHLVRTAQQINVSLSQMADQKASILMGATFVVFTISVGQARSGGFSLALMVLALFSFLSAMLAVFAVLPSVKGKAPAGRPNLLFFGVFTHMSETEFADAVLEELHADETVFRTILRDIYQNGQVLQNKKYKFLGWAYRTFLVGLVLTFLSFVGQYLVY